MERLFSGVVAAHLIQHAAEELLISASASAFLQTLAASLSARVWGVGYGRPARPLRPQRGAFARWSPYACGHAPGLLQTTTSPSNNLYPFVIDRSRDR